LIDMVKLFGRDWWQSFNGKVY